jgi:hypothetical protein
VTAIATLRHVVWEAGDDVAANARRAHALEAFEYLEALD